MTIGTINGAFTFGTDMDLFDVSLLAAGTNSAQTSSSYLITLGSESLVIGGVGLTFDGSGNLSGGTVTSIQDRYLGVVNFDLTGFSISAVSLQQWAVASSTSSLLSALFSAGDTLTGGPLADVLRAYGGGDSISGGGGDDIIDGGLGNDTLNGGGGHDVIITGGGTDTIIVGQGNSPVSVIACDVITDWNAADTLTFASGPAGTGDYAETSAADFNAAAVAANAMIAPGSTNLVVVAVGSDLVVFADSANNNGSADDAVMIRGRGRADIGIGNITTSPSVVPTPPTVGGNSPSGSTTGTIGNDNLTASVNITDVHGGAGNDTIIGASVHDVLRGDEGDDSISGGAAFDDALGNMGNDTVHGNDGDDFSVGGKDQDLLFGDAGGDVVWGNLGDDTCNGGDGNDQVRGGQGNDVVDGGTGDDYVSGDKGNDSVTGGTGADLFHTFQEAGIDRVLDFHLSEGDRVMLDPGTTYSVSQVGADTVIDMGAGNQMILVGISMSSLTPGWIFGA